MEAAPAPAPTNRNEPNLPPPEKAFLRLFGKTDLFGGVTRAMVEVIDALKAALIVYGLDRFDLWAKRADRFVDRLDAIEAAGRPDLGLPSTEEAEVAPGDRLSRLEDSSLEREELLRIKALFGARIAAALSRSEALPKSAIDAHESLLICQRNRSRQHEDWRRVCSHASVDEPALGELKGLVKTVAVRNYIDDCLVALASPIIDPSVAEVAAEKAAHVNGVAATDTGDDDPTDSAFADPADVEIPSPPSSESVKAQEAKDVPQKSGQPHAEPRTSLIGWRIVDGLHAPYTRKLGVTRNWGALPLPDLSAVCRSLKHDFLSKGVEVKNQVCLAYHSQQCSLPPQLAVTVPLRDTGGLFFDVEKGCYWIPYAQVLGKDSAEASKPEEVTTRYGRARIFIDPDLAEHHRQALSRVPDAKDLGDLIEAGVTPAARRMYIRSYRAFLRAHGDNVHPAYSGRHARSLGPAILESTGNDILAMFLALDGSMTASGMLHYVTLSERFVHTQQQRMLERLGWKAPPDLDEESQEPLGAGQALPWDRFRCGWQSVQQECTEALANLAAATSLAEIASAWDKLATARLLSFGCLSGHRLSRIARLTGQALFGHERYIVVSDKVTSNYDAYRLLPVTARLGELRACLLADLAELRVTITRLAPGSPQDEVFHGTPNKAVFFHLKEIQRDGVVRLKRQGLDLRTVERLSQKHFGREANIGRHQLVSSLLEARVDPWLIRALTGHFNQGAEAFGDAAAIAPKRLLEQLRVALDSLLSDDRFAPHQPASCVKDAVFTRALSVPPVDGDAYIHLLRGTGGRVLPPAADRHTLVSLTITELLRSALLQREDDRDPWVDVLWSLHVFDGLHHKDVEELWPRLPEALVSVRACCAAAWTREGRSNLMVVPLAPPTLAAIARTEGTAAPKWSVVTAKAGLWLKGTTDDLRWPADNFESYISFTAMTARWLRVNLNPATFAASLRSVMSPTLSAHSILRLADDQSTEIPAEALSAQRSFVPGATRLRTGSLRESLRSIGTVLFRYGSTKRRHGEDKARATAILSDLAEPNVEPSGQPDDSVTDEESAKAMLKDLAAQDPSSDLPALAALAVVRKEAQFIIDRDKERRSWGTASTYWTEVALALDLISPSDDMRLWCSADFEAWAELAVSAIAIDARKKGKQGAPEIDGLRRFLKVGRMLGWEVPPGLIGGQDVYQQDGMRQSSAATLLMTEDFEAARPLVRHALRDWPLAKQRADLLLNLLIEAPARSGELDTLFSRCVTTASRMLCIEPAGFSTLKNALAVRPIKLTEPTADCLLDIKGEEIDALGEFLFLEDGGQDWTMLKAIRDAIHQALLAVTWDVNLRFHSARGSSACRIAFPHWESWARGLTQGTTGASFDGQSEQFSRRSVADAIAACGHGRTLTFIGYYYSAWPWVRAHELRLALADLDVPVEYEKQLFNTTEARRAAKSRAQRSGQKFDIWDWIGRQMSARIDAQPLESGQAGPIVTPEAEDESAQTSAEALTLFGLLTLAGVPSATAGHWASVDCLTSNAMNEALHRLAPHTESVWARRGQPRGERGAATDRSLAEGEVGRSLCKHFAGLPTGTVSLLSDCLAIDRRRLLLRPDDDTSQNQMIREVAGAMPSGLVKLMVRPPLTGRFRIATELVLELANAVTVGNAERDVGQHCLYQIVPADDVNNRKRTGPLTALVRAVCIAALAAHQVTTEKSN